MCGNNSANNGCAPVNYCAPVQCAPVNYCAPVQCAPVYYCAPTVVTTISIVGPTPAPGAEYFLDVNGKLFTYPNKV